MKRKAPRQHIEHLPGGTHIRYCRNCDKPIPKGCGRTSYCSKECAVDFEVKYFPSRTRIHIFKRDHGVCAKCGCDTEKLRRILVAAQHAGHRLHNQDHPAWSTVPQIAAEACREYWKDSAYIHALGELGFGTSLSRGALWQADHVVECARGGWGMGLENFRTLCTPCHQSESARLAAELAAERQAKKRPADLFTSLTTTE